ncbi:TatD family hydrolase [Buchnera aphidicola]|uniref:TatD family hydrolase n=1 Tax=Buchnera aphidicola TaxID=9 RepID=UPI00094CA82E|nr:TatD family hydrolase [Buchnera aphidicola]
MFLIDSHCHINRIYNAKKKININNILNKAYSKHVKLFLSVSTSLSDFNDLFKLTSAYRNIFLSCGLHPCYSHLINDIQDIKSLATNKKVIAIGETGLDFYRSQQKKTEQITLFEKHICISRITKKPLIIHNRHADNEVINTLENQKNKLSTGIIHSFTGTTEFAKKILDLGFYISFSGIITFKKSHELRSVIKFIPLDRLLIETDSPYLAPEPYRGTNNQPYLLYYIAQTVKKCLNIDLDNLSEILKKNFFELFNIKNF